VERLISEYIQYIILVELFGECSDEAVEVMFRRCSVKLSDELADGVVTEQQLVLPG